ncbi:transposase [Sphingobacterium sp. SG20118]|uniref:transposase n=1 Tax=Sphingobacterium sp. SG20118 TaxID=3367156 RepID=UPI0037DFC895
MRTKIRKKYDRSFKERAVELSKDRKNISELARELGVSASNKNSFISREDLNYLNQGTVKCWDMMIIEKGIKKDI